ncbi:MAG: hypothetical protein ORN57_02620 [Alphaproteobacteria bacterium]|nr:hypothetical protein [Alphaproteobacteria bacterium]
MLQSYRLSAILLSGIILSQAQPALADAVIKANNNDSKPEISFSLTPAIMYFSYREYLSEEHNKPLMDITGPLYGIETSLKINLNPKEIVGLTLIPFDIGFYGGTKLTYHGAKKGDDGVRGAYGTLAYNNEQIFLFWHRTLAGPSFNFLHDYRISLLSGYGYKYTLAKTTEDPDYGPRENIMNYVPLALQFHYNKGHLDIVAHAEYDFFLGGLQKTAKTDDKGKSFYSVEHQQLPGTGRGARTFVEVSYYGATITPFFNYFWIDDSELSRTFTTEPRNATIEAGAKIGYKF